jgi:hypothetical protein
MEGRMLRSKRFVVMLALGMALAIPATAIAVSGYVLHPSDPSYGFVRDNHRTLYACDIHRDGNRVRLHFMNQATVYHWDYYTTNWAPSGACAAPQNSQSYIIRVRVCVENEGCSRWKE